MLYKRLKNFGVLNKILKNLSNKILKCLLNNVEKAQEIGNHQLYNFLILLKTKNKYRFQGNSRFANIVYTKLDETQILNLWKYYKKMSNNSITLQERLFYLNEVYVLVDINFVSHFNETCCFLLNQTFDKNLVGLKSNKIGEFNDENNLENLTPQEIKKAQESMFGYFYSLLNSAINKISNNFTVLFCFLLINFLKFF